MLLAKTESNIYIFERAERAAGMMPRAVAEWVLLHVPYGARKYVPPAPLMQLGLGAGAGAGARLAACMLANPSALFLSRSDLIRGVGSLKSAETSENQG